MEITEKRQVVICVATGLLVVVASWFAFTGRGDVSDIQQRANETRNELESAQQEQRNQAESLDRATEAADRSQSAIRNSQKTTGRIEEIERSDREIIRECQSILETVRSRGKAEN